MIYKHKYRYEGTVQILPSPSNWIKFVVKDQRRRSDGVVLYYPKRNNAVYQVISSSYPFFDGDIIRLQGFFVKYRKDVVRIRCSGSRAVKLSKVIHSLINAGFTVQT